MCFAVRRRLLKEQRTTVALNQSRAPAALNAISEEVLRAQVLAALGCPAAEEASVRSPLLAPFITHGLLLRVCNILSTIDDNGRSSGLTQQQARSKVVAALTGAPPVPDSSL